MKPRWNLDVLRGVLLAVTLDLVWKHFGAFCFGIFPYHPTVVWSSLSIIVVFALCSGALLCPTRLRLQAVFVLFAVMAILPFLIMFYWLRNPPDHALFSSRLNPFNAFRPSLSFFFARIVNIAEAAGAWWLYRAGPKAAS